MAADLWSNPMFNPLMQRWRCLVCGIQAPPVSRRSRPVTPAQLGSALSALGCVLYLPMPVEPDPDGMAPGLLAEDRELMPLLRVRSLVAASVIGMDGPREWVECLDRRGRECARVYLLPDTDYLAWDAWLNVDASPAPMLQDAREHCMMRPLSAQCVRFRLRQWGGLSVLGCRAAPRVSPLGVQLAQRVAHAEAVRLRAAWQH